MQPVPVQVPYVKPDPEKANPKIGVGQVAFSRDNRYLATKNGKYGGANGGNPWFLCLAKKYGILQNACTSLTRLTIPRKSMGNRDDFC